MQASIISDIIYTDVGPRPTLLKFQNGELRESKNKEVSCGIFVNDKNKHIITLASDTHVYSGQPIHNDAYNHFLCIRDPGTNKMKLIVIDHAMLRPEQHNNREILDSTQMEVNKSAITDLNKEFGSKKTKRQTENMEKLRLNVDNFKDQLEKTVADITLDNITQEQSHSDYLPYINRAAEAVEDVYTLHKTIPKFVIKSLKSSVDSLITIGEDEISTSNFIKTKLLACRGSENESTKDTIAMLLVLDGLINIYSSKAKDIATRNYQTSMYSKILSDFILDNFTVLTDQRRTRPLSMKDKACCYILVILLLIGKYKTDLMELGTVLNMSKKKLQELCSMLLVHVKDNIAFIKLPLPAPKSLKRPVKKGRK